ncbi:MAG: serine/threonine protein kinase [Kofleriaceae bacterium]
MFLSAGAHLDKYQIVAPLAVGGMAELYLARIRGTAGFERLCVVKRILPQHARDEMFVKMFLDEARLAATLRHPNVIDVYDVGVGEGRYYFVMEYVHGQDLAALMAAARTQKRGLKVGSAIGICIAAAAGLHHAHEQVGPDGKPLKIVHRDISPGNILVSYDGHVKVVDFGIAKAAARATQTTAGGMKGKLCYMSPEQVLASADLDHRSDVFSLGVVLYELTTGRALFRGESDYLISMKITSGEITPPSEARPGYDPRLEAIVMKALAMNPRDRWQTAQELQHALEDYARSAQLTTASRALGELMRDLFASHIEEWEQAQRAGRSLADHVRQSVQMAAVDPMTDPYVEIDLAPPPKRSPRWPTFAAVAVLVGVSAGAATLIARSGGESEKVTAESTPGSATTPLITPVLVPVAVTAPAPAPVDAGVAPVAPVPVAPVDDKPKARTKKPKRTPDVPTGNGSASKPALDDVVDPYMLTQPGKKKP